VVSNWLKCIAYLLLQVLSMVDLSAFQMLRKGEKKVPTGKRVILNYRHEKERITKAFLKRKIKTVKSNRKGVSFSEKASSQNGWGG